jgi:AcrR family transcriptional regulator
MAHTDWLVGQDRRSAAAERIYSAATRMVARVGAEGLTIDALAAKVHCSPATIYRHVGGKSAILEAVIVHGSARVVEAVREAIAGLDGTDRVVTAMLVALDRIRAEPLGPLIIASIKPDHDREWLTASPRVAELAEEIIGTADPAATQWLLRVTLALWHWPVKDRETEYDLVRRFVGPSFENAA